MINIFLIVLRVVGIVALIYGIVWLIMDIRKVRKMRKALRELHTTPIKEWEEKWGEWVTKEYNKCDDPHRKEVEENMKFFKDCLKELDKEDKK